MKLGSTTLPLAGWIADPLHAKASRTLRLSAMRQLVQEYDLSAVELTMDLAMIYPQVFDTTFYASIAALQQELGFTCTVHLPFLWIDLSALNETVRLASADCITRTAALTHGIEVTSHVLHLWGLTTAMVAATLRHPDQRQALLDAILKQAEHSLAHACRHLGAENLCVENLDDPIFDATLPLLARHQVGICFDVGHLAWEHGNEIDFWAKHRAQIREVHLHDALRPSPDGLTPFRDHLALGQGEIDFARLLDELRTAGFDGAVILENNSRADLEESLHRIRTSDLTV